MTLHDVRVSCKFRFGGGSLQAKVVLRLREFHFLGTCCFFDFMITTGSPKVWTQGFVNRDLTLYLAGPPQQMPVWDLPMEHRVDVEGAVELPDTKGISQSVYEELGVDLFFSLWFVFLNNKVSCVQYEDQRSNHILS